MRKIHRWSRFLFLVIGLVAATGWKGILQDVPAQDLPVGQGSLVVDASAVLVPTLGGRVVRYAQVNQDFLTGYAGVSQSGISDEDQVAFNLDFVCIPWLMAESAHSSPIGEEWKEPVSTVTRANECLLYFGTGTGGQLPEDVLALPFEDLLTRLETYLERAVPEQAETGIDLFILREPIYPTSNELDLSPGEWHRLMLQACTVIRAVNPSARIGIEIVPQYLPSLGYTPYTFLDGLIRAGAPFDVILMSFSPPVITKLTKDGFPDPNWMVAQLDTYADLGRQLLVRLSGFESLGTQPGFQEWLDLTYDLLSKQPTVIGIYWNALSRHPERLAAVSWDNSEKAGSGSLVPERLEYFIRSHTSQGATITDANGQALIQAYAGEYLIELDGFDGVIHAHVFRGEHRYLTIVGSSPPASTGVAQSGSASRELEPPGRDEIPYPTVIAFLVLVLGMVFWGIHSQRSTKHKNAIKRSR